MRAGRLAAKATFAATLMLAACSSPSEAPQVAESGEMIECMVGGATRFARACGVDRSRVDGALFLTVRHPDGAFRRFEVLDDGGSLAVADGAMPAMTRLEQDHAELAVGNDRYRFPVTVKDNAAQKP